MRFRFLSDDLLHGRNEKKDLLDKIWKFSVERREIIGDPKKGCIIKISFLKRRIRQQFLNSYFRAAVWKTEQKEYIKADYNPFEKKYQVAILRQIGWLADGCHTKAKIMVD